MTQEVSFGWEQSKDLRGMSALVAHLQFLILCIQGKVGDNSPWSWLVGEIAETRESLQGNLPYIEALKEQASRTKDKKALYFLQKAERLLPQAYKALEQSKEYDC